MATRGAKGLRSSFRHYRSGPATREDGTVQLKGLGRFHEGCCLAHILSATCSRSIAPAGSPAGALPALSARITAMIQVVGMPKRCDASVTWVAGQQPKRTSRKEAGVGCSIRPRLDGSSACCAQEHGDVFGGELVASSIGEAFCADRVFGPVRVDGGDTEGLALGSEGPAVVSRL